MGNNPVDPFSDPTVERDQRFMERIENIKTLTFGAGVLVSQSAPPPSVGAVAGVPEASADCTALSAAGVVSHGLF